MIGLVVARAQVYVRCRRTAYSASNLSFAPTGLSDGERPVGLIRN